MNSNARIVARSIIGYARPAFDVELDGVVIRSSMHRPTDAEVAEAVHKARNPDPPRPARVIEFGRNLKKSPGRPRKDAKRDPDYFVAEEED